MRTDSAPTLRPRISLKVLFIAVGCAGLLAAGCGRGKPENAQGAAAPAGQQAAGKPGAAAQVAAMTITTTKVGSEDVVRNVPATGTIHPWQEVIVGAEVGGYRVAAVLVDVGTKVKKGQVLVQLAETCFRQTLIPSAPPCAAPRQRKSTHLPPCAAASR